MCHECNFSVARRWGLWSPSTTADGFSCCFSPHSMARDSWAGGASTPLWWPRSPKQELLSFGLTQGIWTAAVRPSNQRRWQQLTAQQYHTSLKNILNIRTPLSSVYDENSVKQVCFCRNRLLQWVAHHAKCAFRVQFHCCCSSHIMIGKKKRQMLRLKIYFKPCPNHAPFFFHLTYTSEGDTKSCTVHSVWTSVPVSQAISRTAKNPPASYCLKTNSSVLR